MKNKLFNLKAVVLLLCSGVFFISCNECETEATRLKINSIDAEFVKITGITKGSDNYDYFDFKNTLLDTNGIYFDSVGILISNEIQSFSNNFSFQLINKAYACEPVYEFKGIDSLFIYSDADYDAQHPSGTNLRDIMGFRGNTLVENDSEKNVQGSLAFLNFMRTPKANSVHNLTIAYKLIDGSVKSFIMPRVKILKH